MSTKQMKTRVQGRELVEDGLQLAREAAESVGRGATAVGRSVRGGALEVREKLPELSAKQKVATAAVIGAAAVAGAVFLARAKRQRLTGADQTQHGY